MSADDFKTLRTFILKTCRCPVAPCTHLAALDHIEASAAAMREALESLLSTPWVVDEATVPRMGADTNPEQVVGTLGVGLTRLRSARAALATDAGAGLLARLEQAEANAKGNAGEAALLRGQRDDLREEMNRAALDLSAARAELASRDATLTALRDAVARLDHLTQPTLAAVHAP